MDFTIKLFNYTSCTCGKKQDKCEIRKSGGEEEIQIGEWEREKGRMEKERANRIKRKRER